MNNMTGMTLTLLMIMGALLTFNPVSAEQVQCSHCPEDYPCSVLFEFRDVRFDHKVFCRVDSEGREKWDSHDPEKFDVFFFEPQGVSTSESEVQI